MLYNQYRLRCSLPVVVVIEMSKCRSTPNVQRKVSTTFSISSIRYYGTSYRCFFWKYANAFCTVFVVVVSFYPYDVIRYWYSRGPTLVRYLWVRGSLKCDENLLWLVTTSSHWSEAAALLILSCETGPLHVITCIRYQVTAAKRALLQQAVVQCRGWDNVIFMRTRVREFKMHHRNVIIRCTLKCS